MVDGAGNASELLDWTHLQEAAECLRTIAHPVRLRMLQLLLRERLTVGQLARACAVPSHMASEHLRLMQRCGLLDSRRRGRCTYYRIVQPHVAGVIACMEDHFRSAGGVGADLAPDDSADSDGGEQLVSKTRGAKRSGKVPTDLLLVGGLLAGWFALQVWILPGMGVST